MSIQRLRTDKETEKLIVEMQSKLNFSTKAAVIRLSIALSLQNSEKISTFDESELDKNGSDYTRLTLTGEDDILFKVAMMEHQGFEFSDEEYFPKVFNAHLVRGIKILASEYDYAGSKERMLDMIMKKKAIK
jgi:DNA sulfur modification protein DndE